MPHVVDWQCLLTSLDTSALASFWLSNIAAMNSLKLMPSVWESTCEGGAAGSGCQDEHERKAIKVYASSWGPTKVSHWQKVQISARLT